jgi:hypothetical protein
MRLTIDLDTDQLTDRDRRVFAALISDDSSPLVLPRFPGTDNGAVDEHRAAAPPLPVPVPADFAARLGEAVQQFGPRGSGPEARLPFAQQAGVRTSSTMPDDDDDASEFEAQVMAAAQTPLPDGPLAHPHAPDVDGPAVIRARGGMTVPRDLVEDDGPPRRIEDVTRNAILGVVEPPPVRHTSP